MGSRESIDDAKEWVDEQLKLAKVDDETATKVKQLVQRYRTLR